MNERLTLQDLVDILSQKQDMTKKDAEVFLRELITLISETIEQNDPVKIKDFGTFKLVKVNARKSVDVNTGEAIEIPAHYKLSFVPDKTLKEAINHPFAHFESVVLEEGISFENVETIETNAEGEEVEIEEVDEYKEEETLPESKSLTAEETNKESDTALADSYIAVIETEKKDGLIEEVPSFEEPDTITEGIILNTEEAVRSDISLDYEIADIDSSYTETIETPIPQKESEDLISEASLLVENATFLEKEGEEKIKETVESPIEDGSETESEKMFKSHKRKTIRRRFISLGFILLLIVGAFALGGLYFQEIMNCFSDNIQKSKTEKATSIVETNDAIKVTDTSSVTVNTVDSTTVVALEKEEIKSSLIIKDTIKAGSTLRLMSLKHFGHKSFWPYIYEENKEVIKNPNNVPLGTELIIPPADKYDIDAKNKESIQKAKEKESSLIREFNL